MKVVPYGNARVQHGKIQCQHGEPECQGNRWQQCAIHAYPDQAEHIPFIICTEEHGDDMLNHMEKCATKSGLVYSKLSACYNSPLSDQLQQQAAEDTPSDHKYVPWILIDGKLSPSDGDHILQEVCAKYTGNKPAGCSAAVEPQRTEFLRRDGRCFVDEEQKLGAQVE